MKEGETSVIGVANEGKKKRQSLMFWCIPKSQDLCSMIFRLFLESFGSSKDRARSVIELAWKV